MAQGAALESQLQLIHSVVHPEVRGQQEHEPTAVLGSGYTGHY